MRVAAWSAMPTCPSTSSMRRRAAAPSRPKSPSEGRSPVATTSRTVTGSAGSSVAFWGT